MRVRHADLGVGPAGNLATDHERGDPGQVGLVGQRLQVEHQLGVLADGVGNPRGLLDHRKLTRALFLGLLDAPLDVAHGIEILVELRPIAGPESPLELGRTLGDRIEQAGILPPARAPHRGVGRATVAEQPFEDHPWVVLHRERRRLVGPRNRVGEGATENRRPHDPVKSRPSSASSSDASCVCCPSSRAASWSIEVPASRSAPSAEVAGTPVRNRVDALACTPLRSPRALGAVEAGQHPHVIPKRLERLQDLSQNRTRPPRWTASSAPSASRSGHRRRQGAAPGWPANAESRRTRAPCRRAVATPTTRQSPGAPCGGESPFG